MSPYVPPGSQVQVNVVKLFNQERVQNSPGWNRGALVRPYSNRPGTRESCQAGGTLGGTWERAEVLIGLTWETWEVG